MEKLILELEIWGEIAFTDELRLADVVFDIKHPESGLAVVTNIDENAFVHFVRHYPHTADFSYTGGVIVYAGTERWATDNEQKWIVVSRKELR